ncbi:MAG: ribosomal protein S18-alanine N-acetyltransferase [Elusimicrobiales bacterium]
MIIRKANSCDINDIVVVESDWKDEYPCWGRDGFLKEFEKKNSITFVAEISNKIVGFVNIWIADVIEINSLVVSKSHLRQGIATQLLGRIIDEALSRGIERIVLEVRKNNIPALNLYVKNGFNVYNIRKKYYDFKYDAIMMERIIRRG